MTPSDRFIRVGLVGLGGYPSELADLLLADAKQPSLRLVSVTAIDTDQHPARVEMLRDRGIEVQGSFDAMLADDAVEAVWLPVPIHLHKAMALRVLGAGKHLILEKPVAGCLADHREIADAQASSGVQAFVGFQDVYAHTTAVLKRGLLTGSFGKVQRCSVLCSWPRGDAYFRRNAGAGRLEVEGAPVRDSPLNNAMAHFVNLALFLLGGELNSSAYPRVEVAELYRARPIETFDTCSVRAALPSPGTELVINLTHASSERIDPIIEIQTDRGVVRWRFSGEATFRLHDRMDGVRLSLPNPPRPMMVGTIARLLAGVAAGDQLTRADLLNTMAHTALVEQVHAMGKVIDADPLLVDVPDDTETEARSMVGLAGALGTAFAGGTTLSRVGFRV